MYKRFDTSVTNYSPLCVSLGLMFLSTLTILADTGVMLSPESHRFNTTKMWHFRDFP
jgi:hypothetical protein